MKTPSKAILTCTANEYSWRVYSEDGELIAERRMVRSPHGAKGTEKANRFDTAMDDWPDLYDAIESDDGYGVMAALGRVSP